jgi:hypothetical protein
MAASSLDRPTATGDRRIALVDLLDRVLSTGVVITGDLTLCIADIDLVRISLRAFIQSVNDGTAQRHG